MLHEYELSPKESESILETAKTLFDSGLDQTSHSQDAVDSIMRR